MKTLINSMIPDFELQAYHQNEFKTVKSEDLKNKWYLLFFYPADFTFVCPTELADLEEKYAELKSLNIEVFSVSTDTHFTHKAWHDTSETIKKINYAMLSDPTAKLSENLGVYNEETGLTYRGTFLIDPDGKIKLAEINDDGIGRNADEIVRKIKAAQFVRENKGEVCPAKWQPGEKTLKPGLNLVGKI